MMKTTEENYKEVVLKRAIITCWILLLVCFVIKLFGGNFFNIVCGNDVFVKVCNYIDNSWLYCVFAYFCFVIQLILLLIIVRDDKRLRTKNTLLFAICVSVYWVFKLLIQLKIIVLSNIWIDVIDYGSMYLLLVLFTKKPLKSFLALILMLVFTIISVITKGTGLNNNLSESALVGIIFMIDYYIMLVLTYFYSIKLKRRK